MSKDLERSIKDRIREIAKAENRTFNDLWKTLVLERFLARLSRSPQVENLVFKGGALLSKYLPLGRETIDLDFLAVNLHASVESIRDAIESILNVPYRDGFSFTEVEIEQLAQLHMNYPGYTVKAQALLGDTRTDISIDIGIGDVVANSSKDIEFLSLKGRPLFEPAVAIQVYPLEYIFAEKLETVIYRGATNSRMKDFYDLWLMLTSPSFNLSSDRAQTAVLKTFTNRGTTLTQVAPLFLTSTAIFESNWRAFCRGLPNEVGARVPSTLADIYQQLDRWLSEHLFVG